MTIDSVTLSKLQHQGRRMRFALENGNQREAEVIQRRVDTILDERPRVFAVAADGEVVYDNASPWVKDQLVAVVYNAGPESEKVLVESQIAAMVAETERMLGASPHMAPPDDTDGGAGTGGGVGLPDRP